MTHRQIGEAEAVYRLLPNMLLKNSNVDIDPPPPPHLLKDMDQEIRQ